MNSEIVESKPKKVYDTKKYVRDFIERHKNEKFTCDVCLKSVSIFNKSHHYKSKYHNGVVNILEKQKAQAQI
jgi:hypothetical protein